MSQFFMIDFPSGTCIVTPENGVAMNTSFTIKCSEWADPDSPFTYEFAYLTDFQPSVLYVSKDSTPSSILLPMGHESNDFKLTLRMRIIDHLGAATAVFRDLKVRRKYGGEGLECIRCFCALI